MNTLAFIPARGGSKGVPRKNIKLIAGRPLIAWAIESALHSKFISRVVVSTDDKEIADVARSYGAEVPFMRPSALAQDLSTTHETLVHALDWFAAEESYEPDVVVLLPPTAPLVTTVDVDAGIAALRQDVTLDSVRPIVESPKHPYKALRIKGNLLVPFFPDEVTGFKEAYDLPRQLFPPVYVYSGAFQVIKRATVLDQKSLSGRKMGYVHMPAERSVNIDTLDDFQYADMLLRRRLEQMRGK